MDSNKVEYMTFDKAMTHLLAGEKIARKSWMGKEHYIKIGYMKEYTDSDGDAKNRKRLNQSIILYGENGLQRSWFASQRDLLGDDWYIKEV